jgi:hypothetical protein
MPWLVAMTALGDTQVIGPQLKENAAVEKQAGLVRC